MLDGGQERQFDGLFADDGVGRLFGAGYAEGQQVVRVRLQPGNLRRGFLTLDTIA
jgi:hypothetical protein